MLLLPAAVVTTAVTSSPLSEMVKSRIRSFILTDFSPRLERLTISTDGRQNSARTASAKPMGAAPSKPQVMRYCDHAIAPIFIPPSSTG